MTSLDRLAADFGDRWITAPGLLDRYRPLEGHHPATAPDLVVQPLTIAEVQRVVRAAHESATPIVPWGVGTSLEGNAAVGPGALCVDLSAMNRVVEVAEADLLCVVEPGVTREQLNAELRATGLFFPIDPGANATLGGMIATRASGTNAVRYGTMRENVLALQVVLPDGRLIHTGTRARKSAAGYDLTHLFTGSEGTLGLIVEATLRLHGIPETVLSGTWPFATMAGAVDTVIAAVQSGIPVARIELLDEAAIRACNAHASLDLRVQPMLFVELHGSASAVAEQQAMLAAIGADRGGGPLSLSTDRDEQRRLWRARHQALPAARALVPGAVTWISDICVPISKLADAIARAQQAIADAGLVAPILGHVGDGNFHVFFVLHPDDREAWARAAAVNAAMIDFALSVGGTCTGEHGIGIGKREALVREHGAEAVAVMRDIKRALDPQALMNPGKISQTRTPDMSTETVDPRFIDLDRWPTALAVEAMLEGQLAAVAAVKNQTAAIAAACDAAAPRLRRGGRLVYAGAGTSGRIAVQDGVELYPTYNWPRDRLVFLLAGGTDALAESAEGAEDDADAARAAVTAEAVGADDIVIGVAASGRTPFTVAVIDAARAAGAITIGVANNPATALLAAAEHPILADTGSELVAGSTRMKAGTAQKVVLNILSTAMMLRCGLVYQGLMVNMRVSNEKLAQRANAIVCQTAGVSPDVAAAALATAGDDIKTAVLVARGLDARTAGETLARHHNNLRAAIEGGGGA